MTLLLTDLPPELLEGIFGYLDWSSAVQIREVSRLCRDIVDECATLQYGISLAIAGLKDGPSPSPKSASDRMKRLQDYQHAWNTLKWSSQSVLKHQRGRLWELYSGVIGQVTLEGSFIFHRLPSDLRQITLEEWTVKGPEFQVRDFGMDYSQNLLVQIQNPIWQPTHLRNRSYRIHLRSLSDGSPHPSAPKSAVLVKEQKPSDPMVSFGLQICGPYLGIHFVSHSQHAVHEINVWNWKTGELLLHLLGDEMTSFVFLSERHILVTCVHWNFGLTCLMRVIDFSKALPDRTNIDDAASISFQLPRWSDRSQLLNLTVRCDPAPGWQPVEPDAPFVLGSDERLLVITLESHAGGRHCSTALFVLQSALLHLVTSRADDDDMDDDERDYIVPWELWGPGCTRVLNLPSSPSRVWVCYTFGTRFVHQCARVTEGGQDVWVDVFDFNQLAIRKEGGEGCVTESSIIESKNDVFVEDVMTFLPYRKTSLNLNDFKGQLNTVMCSQDNLILVCRDGQYRILNF